ncbi:MAG: hypothetical protein P9L91_02795 [Candidatus Zophobacter franzmannii]|nr:hypothetical protein [Candidatus Zophobacter franzmannii]
MATTKDKLQVEVTVKGAKTATKQMGTFNSKIGSATKSLIKMGIGLVGIQQGLRFIGSSITASLEQDKVMQRLAAQIDLTGASYKSLSREIEENLKWLQKNAGYGDTESADALQKLIALTGSYEKANANLALTLDVASSGLFDVKTAARLVGQAIIGDITMLGRYIPELKTTNNEQLALMTSAEKGAFALGLLEEKFGGLSESMAKSRSGEMKRWKDSASDLKEEVGLGFTIMLGGLGKLFLDQTEALNGLNNITSSTIALAKEMKGLSEDELNYEVYKSEIMRILAISERDSIDITKEAQKEKLNTVLRWHPLLRLLIKDYESEHTAIDSSVGSYNKRIAAINKLIKAQKEDEKKKKDAAKVIADLAKQTADFTQHIEDMYKANEGKKINIKMEWEAAGNERMIDQYRERMEMLDQQMANGLVDDSPGPEFFTEEEMELFHTRLGAMNQAWQDFLQDTLTLTFDWSSAISGEMEGVFKQLGNALVDNFKTAINKMLNDLITSGLLTILANILAPGTGGVGAGLFAGLFGLSDGLGGKGFNGGGNTINMDTTNNLLEQINTTLGNNNGGNGQVAMNPVQMARENQFGNLQRSTL